MLGFLYLWLNCVSKTLFLSVSWFSGCLCVLKRQLENGVLYCQRLFQLGNAGGFDAVHRMGRWLMQG